jgi:hypothetical protein
MVVNLSSCSSRIPVRSSLCVLAFFFLFFFFFLFAISLYQIHRARLVPRSSGHELYVIPILKQTIFFTSFACR